jgi:hypothetical protein
MEGAFTSGGQTAADDLRGAACLPRTGGCCGLDQGLLSFFLS